jgi:hypothetical protein
MCLGKALEFVNCYEYLGVLLQQSWTFTKHLRKRKVKMMARMGMIRNLDRLSMKGAERFFNVMLRPTVTYAVQSFWLYLKFNHFEILDSCKLLFYKRVMGLSKGAINRKVNTATHRRLGQDYAYAHHRGVCKLCGMFGGEAE